MYKKLSSAFFIIFLIAFSQNSFSQEMKKSSSIKWLSLEDALSNNSDNPKKIFIDVYTNWCGWCKRMDATTFEDAEVANYINENYYAVKLNAETKDKLTYKDKVYPFKPEYKANEFAVIILNGKMSYPTSVYLDENSNPIGPVPGYLTKEQIMPVLKYFAENLYKTKNWEEYMKENSR